MARKARPLAVTRKRVLDGEDYVQPNARAIFTARLHGDGKCRLSLSAGLGLFSPPCTFHRPPSWRARRIVQPCRRS